MATRSGIDAKAAIKLAEDHQKKYSLLIKISLSSKVDPWRLRVSTSKSTSKSSPSPSPIGTVIPKLKHLLILALDRVEILKKTKKKNLTPITTYNRSRSCSHRYDLMKETKLSCMSSLSLSLSLPSQIRT